ncbi:hypothetical protein J4463_02970 [Candidatus Pacearchaeota archaeon]|nr:hypothetical protein [uncultured archaeon]MBS3100153.1 hypothetical protein [Candidatus Pacearchaeota archaeon]
MKKDKSIILGILILLSGFFVLMQSDKNILPLILGLCIIGVGSYLIISNTN